MPETAERVINWMTRYQIQEVLENHGFAVYDDESTDALKYALFLEYEEGGIDPAELDQYA